MEGGREGGGRAKAGNQLVFYEIHLESMLTCHCLLF